MNQYKVLDFNEDICECDICGRAELKGTYALLDVETGDIIRAGSSCGATAMKITVKELKAEHKEVEQQKIIDSIELENAALPENKRLTELQASPKNKFTDIVILGLVQNIEGYRTKRLKANKIKK